jgi:hypothetical protein
MKKKALLPLALLLVAAAFSGCAHQNTRTGSRTNILGGLVNVESGTYQPAPINSVTLNTNELVGDIGKPSGTQVGILWGLFTANDY